MVIEHHLLACSPQPIFFDGLCKDPDPIPSMPGPSLHSPTASFSSNYSGASELEPVCPTMLPIYQTTSAEQLSMRSKTSLFRPRRLRWGTIFSRPSYSHLDLERSRSCIVSTSTSVDEDAHFARTSSLKNKSSFPPLRGVRAYSKKPLPQIPLTPAQELTCDRCYYFAARNCNGWVLGGSTGDACEGCLQAGFFGAK